MNDAVISLRFSQVAAELGGEVQGGDAVFTGAAIDTRLLAADELFVAFAGNRVDGHDLVAQARQQGAAGALVQRFVPDPLPQLRVADTRLALGRLAARWRDAYPGKLLALTGSNGKTSVKEMLASILRQAGEVWATRGNLNNDIGMPLTLMGLRARHQYAVLEMGANHHGEIAYLTAIARPDIALITNAGPAHLEGFGSIEGVAHAKGEIISGVPDHGTCVLNADDSYFPLWRQLAGPRRIISFGLSDDADFRAVPDNGDDHHAIRIITRDAAISVHFPLLGAHNIVNALAAAAAASALGLPLEAIKRGLEAVRAVAGRLERKAGVHGAQLIDDTYNANPASVAAALEVLAQFRSSHRVLVLGDMAELGDDAAALHEGIGRQARHLGIENVFTCGQLSAGASSVFGPGAVHCQDKEQLIAAVRALMDANTVVLVKGSRSAHMETVVNGLHETQR